MGKMGAVSRRLFLKQSLSALTGIGLFSIIPLPLLKDHLLLLNEPIIIERQPYWLEVLSRGVSFIPPKAKIDISDWSNDELREKAYYTLRIAFKQNRQILTGNLRWSEKDMGIIIDNNKFGQFLLERIKGKYMFSEELEPITYHQDPIRARIFYDLSSILMKYVIMQIDKGWFRGFTDFDIKLLRSAEGYLREGIRTNESSMDLFPDKYRRILKYNIGTGYNNLGLTLNFLGDIDQAYEMYQIALQYNPDDDNITSNLNDIHENATYIQKRIFWTH